VKRDVQPSFAIWITGLPASGKSTITVALTRKLEGLGVHAEVLESDPLRKEFSDRPSYDERDREFFYGSLAFVGRILTERGVPVIFDATANRRIYRDKARSRIPRFVEVFVECPLETCIERDPKGIYRQAREGKATQVPGIQAVYEPPEHPDVVIRGDRESPDDAANRVIDTLIARGFITGVTSPAARDTAP
jgi:adenylylsulfate kinase